MLLKSHYKISKEYNLLIEYHTGILDVNSYMNFKQKIIYDPLYSPNLHVLINFKNVHMKITQKDVTAFINFMSNNLNSSVIKNVAIITNTPNQVIFTTLFKMEQQQNLSNIEIFSTYENAKKWLNIPNLTTEIIDEIFSKLKNN